MDSSVYQTQLGSRLVVWLVAFGLLLGSGSLAGADRKLDLSQILANTGLSGVGNSDDFLDPDLAFIFSAEQTAADTITTRWAVADDYYLYSDKFKFALADPAQGQSDLLPAQVPKGKTKQDPYFGDVEINTHAFDVPVRLGGLKPAGEHVALKVSYQGCAEGGICYPPITKVVRVPFSALFNVLAPNAAAATASSPVGAAGAPVAAADGIAGRLADSGLAATIATFFGFGLLLAFTPCVFPMIPILSGIIVGQGEGLTTRAAFVLSLVYVVAMATTYALVGVLAARSGHNLQIMFQNPAVLIGFSAVFVLLALSMFGFYELQLPASWQTKLTEVSERQRRGRLGGVASMGVLSAIIVGPCVAPPLAGALLFIAQTGNASTGGLALFSMGLGMGVPLLLIGTSAGHWLPRSGAWMEAVKNVFGVILLGVAVWLLARILPGPVALVLWALLFTVSAVYLGALEPLAAAGSGWGRFRKGVGVVALVYGAALLLGAAAGGDDLMRPLARLAGSQHERVEFDQVKGVAGLRGRLGEGPAMLDFYADWCIECKQMERSTFTDRTVLQSLKNLKRLQTDVTANDASDQKLLQEFELYGPPAILFFDPQGRESRSHRLVGYVAPEAFAQHVQRFTESVK